MRPDRAGPTLVELLLALSLTAVALTVGLAVLDGARYAEQAIDRASREHDAKVGGRQLLRDLLSRSRGGTDLSHRFVGTATRLEFQSWCEGAAADLEHCDVQITLVRGAEGAVVVADWARGRVELGSVSSEAHFAFREIGVDEPTWVGAWSPSQRRPEAVGLIDGPDTLLLPVGAAR